MKSLHTSISENPRIKDYISDDCKYYYLPLHQQTFFPEHIENIIGSSNNKERSSIEIKSSIVKAEASKSSHLKIPIDRVDDPLVAEVIRLMEGSGLGLVLQVYVSLLVDENYYNYLKSFSNNCEIEFIVDQCLEVKRIKELTHIFKSFHFTIPIYKKLNWINVLSKDLVGVSKFFHLYFPYQLEVNSSNLSCQGSHKLFGLLKNKFPNIEFLPPKGVDIWDHRALSDFDMEPYVLPCARMTSKAPSIKYSVIIPTYNNQNHLRVTLRHLYEQDIGLDNFEVIVVDDGGTDQTQNLVMELLDSFEEKMNFKYIFFPRPRKRVMGDSQYRAGISRNLGVKNSSGEILCFLDSDIVTPKNYLKSVGEKLITWDALQAKRVNLTQSASRLDCDYYSVDPERDIFPDESYWEEFIKKTDRWDELPYNWKYVCTHSFSMKKDLFWKLGGLKKNFIFYGFEDTDLGYRLVKRGYKLHLLDSRVYHLFHESARSEFMNLSSLRHNLLSRTAQIFYLHHLDEDIYENLLGFMEPEPTVKRLFFKLWKLCSLQFLWKPRDLVFKSLRRLEKRMC